MANTDYIKVPYLDYMTVVEKACKYEAIKSMYESVESYHLADSVKAILGIPREDEKED